MVNLQTVSYQPTAIVPPGSPKLYELQLILSTAVTQVHLITLPGVYTNVRRVTTLLPWAWAIPRPSCYELLSVVTNRRIWRAEHHQSTDTWRTVIRLLQDTLPGAFGRSLP